jgi:hypothetical protein
MRIEDVLNDVQLVMLSFNGHGATSIEIINSYASQVLVVRCLYVRPVGRVFRAGLAPAPAKEHILGGL